MSLQYLIWTRFPIGALGSGGTFEDLDLAKQYIV